MRSRWAMGYGPGGAVLLGVLLAVGVPDAAPAYAGAPAATVPGASSAPDAVGIAPQGQGGNPVTGPSGASGTAGSRAPLPPGVAAVVNETVLTQQELDAQVKSSGQPDTPALREALRQQFVGREVLRQAAVREQFERQPEAQRVAHEALLDTASRLYLNAHLKVDPVTDQAVRARYEAIRAGLGPQEYQVRVIQVVGDALAQQALARLKAGEPFEVVAAQMSTVPGATAVGGLLPWISFALPAREGQTHGMALPVAQAIVGLRPGETTVRAIAVGPLRVIIRLEQRRPTQLPDYAQTSPALRQALEQTQRQAALARLLAQLEQGAVIR
jgi:peptidyl-prolyl cis-trans isomerase C